MELPNFTMTIIKNILPWKPHFFQQTSILTRHFSKLKQTMLIAQNRYFGPSGTEETLIQCSDHRILTKVHYITINDIQNHKLA